MFCENCGFENSDGDRFCRRCGHALVAPDTLSENHTLEQTGYLGPYELRGELGRGAMARVWRAWDPRLRREVAIKEPLFDARLPHNVLEEMGRRFVAEGVAAARLNHPNIVTIHEADVFDGRPAIVMELVDGVTLSELLRHGPLNPAAASDALEQLLDAVGYAHAQGIVHRDIKPDNVFVSRDGRIKLADFGIAHIDDDAATRATIAGSVLGTPGYMSPEQIKGETVDSRSDLFSIGVVAYEMLTGRNPFGAGENTDVTTLIYRVVNEPVDDLPQPSISGLPMSFGPAVMGALAKDPADRPQSAAEFKAMLAGESVPTAIRPSALGAKASKAADAKGASGWLPYALVTSVGVLVLAFVLISALGGSGGGSTQVAAGNPPSTLSQEDVTSTEDEQAGIDEKKTDGDSKVEDEKAKEAEIIESAASKPKAQYPPVFTDADASSTRPDDVYGSKRYSYAPSNVLDFTNNDIAWNEGVAGAGIGEWIRVSSSNPQLVSGFNILPGYAYSRDRYFHNHRPKTVKIELSDGYEASYSLNDNPCTWQPISFDTEHETTYLKLTITDAYISDGKYDDNCITAIQAF